jgi:ketosteroid isomerase-like protein
VEEVIDLGGRVIVLTAERGVSRAGKVPIAQHGAVIWSFRGLKVSRVETYLQRTTAVEALSPAERTRLETAGPAQTRPVD